jgi:hypothetical protein
VANAIRQVLQGVPVPNAGESGSRGMKLLQWLHAAWPPAVSGDCRLRDRVISFVMPGVPH